MVNARSLIVLAPASARAQAVTIRTGTGITGLQHPAQLAHGQDDEQDHRDDEEDFQQITHSVRNATTAWYVFNGCNHNMLWSCAALHARRDPGGPRLSSVAVSPGIRPRRWVW